MAERLWLYIDFRRLALESQFGPDLSHSPARLLLDHSSQRIVQCNSVAEQASIRAGMTPATAYCLLEQVEIALIDEPGAQHQLQRLALSLYRLCADIHLCQPGGLLLNAAPMLTLFDGLDAWLAQLEKHLSRLGFSYQWGLGHTPLAAQRLALHRPHQCLTQPEEVQAALDPLSVDQLGLTDALATRLSAVGIHTYQQLRCMPGAELGYRFGLSLVRHLQALNQPQPLGQPFQLPKRFRERLELAFEADHAPSLIFPVKRLLQHLEAFLQAHQLTASQLSLTLEHRDTDPTELTIQAVQGSHLAEDWLTLIGLALERQQLPAPVTALCLRLRQTQTETRLSSDLLGTAYPKADADRLLSLLLSRLGPDNVSLTSASADPRPWQAGVLRRLDNPATTTCLPRQQPTLLLGNPSRINRADYQILAGPQRIVTGHWLQSPAFRRDYVIAWQQRSQQVQWLARHDDGHWYLEGLFA